MALVRPRRQPQRTCISCRETQGKRTLVRLVRADSRVTVDETGRANGRGAYLCTNPACWHRSLRAGSIARALKVTLEPEDRQAIEAYAQRLEASSAASDAPPAGSTTEGPSE